MNKEKERLLPHKEKKIHIKHLVCVMLLSRTASVTTSSKASEETSSALHPSAV